MQTAHRPENVITGHTAGANVRREEGTTQTASYVPKSWLSGNDVGRPRQPMLA